MISIFAPEGIGEVTADTDLAAVIVDAVAADPAGPLTDGDILVVTSKIVSKAEARRLPAEHRMEAILAESTATVARRGPMRIVRTRHGLTIAAAGVDNSNVDPDSVLLLPLDPDASAKSLRCALRDRYGVSVGVIISDTAGRAWRIGQTDHAIGSSGVRVLDRYDGRTDPYGNELQVTAVAVADEVAAAADLAKSKLGGRPVAVVRGLSAHLSDGPTDTAASDLIRIAEEDLFGRGSRESVLEAILVAHGRGDQFEEVIDHPDGALADAVLSAIEVDGDRATLVRALVVAAVQGSGHRPESGS
ncbi:MAG: coenzyme F420-0:L-glutamate ligase [Propionibacteriaceae bacterium]|jgi:coenzyme F420-0:L-glutamate ligase/coenzyme F420-1:gamma-L-glutamate ligase|nr:coenzyme F420-0:L-glutamate ligase [Propionibacteriaceae bacterium]